MINQQEPNKGQKLYQLSRQMNKLSMGDIARVEKFVEAMISQKEGKREQRQENIRKFNEGLGEK